MALCSFTAGASGMDMHRAETDTITLDKLRAFLPKREKDAEGLKLASARGVAVVTTKRGEVYLYDKNVRDSLEMDKNGLPLLFSVSSQLGDKDTVQSIRLDSKGKVWLNTTKGVFIHAGVELEELGGDEAKGGIDTPDSLNDKIFFSNIKISGKSIVERINGREADLVGPIKSVTEISLNAVPNSFSLSVMPLEGKSEECLYSWKLEGFDREWSIPSGNSYINYTNLTPGAYTLRVRMRQGGAVGERTLKINVPASLLGSWWFRIIIVMSLLGAVVLLVAFHRRRPSPRSAEMVAAKEVASAPEKGGQLPEKAHDSSNSTGSSSAWNKLLEEEDDDVSEVEVDVNRVAEEESQEDSSDDAKVILSDEIDATNPVSRDEFLQRAEEKVKANISNESFGKADFASSMMISQSLLYKKIKAYTGMSVIEFIRSLRLKYAMELLRSGKYNVTEVSDMCGFSASAYFSRVFKDYYGKNPSEFIGRGQEG